jgi:hypothetical protein
MTEADLSEIEARLGFPLPAAFRATALSYPFPPDSFAAEFMLPNSASDFIGLNESAVTVRGVTRPFFIGDDGGEERYFLDAAKPDSPVYVYELETGQHRVLVPSWPAYLDHIRAAHAEIAADEEATRQRKLTRRWWQLWK